MHLDRRQFLVTTLLAPAVGRMRLPQTPAPSTTPLIDKGFGRVTRVTDDVYVTLADPSKGPGCLSNGGVLVGRDAVLIVEGHFKAEGAALEIEAARMLSKQPIRGVVNTHYHLDHTFGNGGYTSQQIPVIAHEQARALMQSRYVALKGVDKAPLLRPFEQKVAEAANPAAKERFGGDLGFARWMYRSIDAADIVLPTETLTAADCPKHFDLGGLTVVVECRPGHTPTDLIIRVPERDIAFVGDLLFYKEYPVSFDANMIAWRGILGSLSAEPKTLRLVPGHGPICGPEVARELADLLDDLRRHAERMIQAGASAAEAGARYVVPPAFESYEASAWDWTIGAALRGYYASLQH